ncbi:hypothetical protein HDU93_000240 [Gonapodya sp. JEL0774]|nr:hypothetical protein HDU93_000240 [Gonapodya sp. JEL0774]
MPKGKSGDGDDNNDGDGDGPQKTPATSGPTAASTHTVDLLSDPAPPQRQETTNSAGWESDQAVSATVALVVGGTADSGIIVTQTVGVTVPATGAAAGGDVQISGGGYFDHTAQARATGTSTVASKNEHASQSVATFLTTRTSAGAGVVISTSSRSALMSAYTTELATSGPTSQLNASAPSALIAAIVLAICSVLALVALIAVAWRNRKLTRMLNAERSLGRSNTEVWQRLQQGPDSDMDALVGAEADGYTVEASRLHGRSDRIEGRIANNFIASGPVDGSQRRLPSKLNKLSHTRMLPIDTPRPLLALDLLQPQPPPLARTPTPEPIRASYANAPFPPLPPSSDLPEVRGAAWRFSSLHLVFPSLNFTGLFSSTQPSVPVTQISTPLPMPPPIPSKSITLGEAKRTGKKSETSHSQLSRTSADPTGIHASAWTGVSASAPILASRPSETVTGDLIELVPDPPSRDPSLSYVISTPPLPFTSRNNSANSAHGGSDAAPEPRMGRERLVAFLPSRLAHAITAATDTSVSDEEDEPDNISGSFLSRSSSRTSLLPWNFDTASQSHAMSNHRSAHTSSDRATSQVSSFVDIDTPDREQIGIPVSAEHSVEPTGRNTTEIDDPFSTSHQIVPNRLQSTTPGKLFASVLSSLRPRRSSNPSPSPTSDANSSSGHASMSSPMRPTHVPRARSQSPSRVPSPPPSSKPEVSSWDGVARRYYSGKSVEAEAVPEHRKVLIEYVNKQKVAGGNVDIEDQEIGDDYPIDLAVNPFLDPVIHRNHSVTTTITTITSAGTHPTISTNNSASVVRSSLPSPAPSGESARPVASPASALSSYVEQVIGIGTHPSPTPSLELAALPHKLSRHSGTETLQTLPLPPVSLCVPFATFVFSHALANPRGTVEFVATVRDHKTIHERRGVPPTIAETDESSSSSIPLALSAAAFDFNDTSQHQQLYQPPIGLSVSVKVFQEKSNGTLGEAWEEGAHQRWRREMGISWAGKGVGAMEMVAYSMNPLAIAYLNIPSLASAYLSQVPFTATEGHPLPPMTPRLACRLCADIAACVARLHALGVSHLGVSAASVFLICDKVGTEVVPKAALGNFGYAAPGMLEQGSIAWKRVLDEARMGGVGRRRYTSPEVRIGIVFHSLPRPRSPMLHLFPSDIFSLSILLYELLVLHPAWPSFTVDEVTGAVQEGQRPMWDRAGWSGEQWVGDRAKEVVEAGWIADWQERPSALQFRAALLAILNDADKFDLPDKMTVASYPRRLIMADVRSTSWATTL